MTQIKLESNPGEQRLQQLKVSNWPVWTKEVSEFPWYYDEKETCYFLEGDVTVISEDDQTVEMKKGDLVTFPKGMSCTWKIRKDVRKHYKLG